MKGYMLRRSCLASTTLDGTGEFLPTNVLLAFIPAERSWSWTAGFEQHAVVLSLSGAMVLAAGLRQQPTTHRERNVVIELVPAGRRPIDETADALARTRRAA